MIVGNFTPDPIEWMHIGITGVVKSGETAEMEDGRARHVLNYHARRGLVQMQYGDELEAKKKESLAQWSNFWEHQIVTFNQHNEDQKEKGNRYAKPTDEIKAHADALGLELLQPFRIESKDDSPQLKILREENVSLKATVEAQTGQINQILEMIKAGKGLPEAPAETEQPEPPVKTKIVEGPDETPEPDVTEDVVATNKKKYVSLSSSTMKGWLKNNWEEFQGMPEENRFEIISRYHDLYQTPFPEEKPA